MSTLARLTRAAPAAAAAAVATASQPTAHARAPPQVNPNPDLLTGFCSSFCTYFPPAPAHLLVLAPLPLQVAARATQLAVPTKLVDDAPEGWLLAEMSGELEVLFRYVRLCEYRSGKKCLGSKTSLTKPKPQPFRPYTESEVEEAVGTVTQLFGRCAAGMHR
jgi:hypothetical protein